jgi:hypothetical protein
MTGESRLPRVFCTSEFFVNRFRSTAHWRIPRRVDYEYEELLQYLKKIESFLGMCNGTRRSCLMEKIPESRSLALTMVFNPIWIWGRPIWLPKTSKNHNSELFEAQLNYKHNKSRSLSKHCLMRHVSEKVKLLLSTQLQGFQVYN